MKERIAGYFKAIPEAWRDTAFWLLLLVGAIPALRADLLLPHTWLSALDSTYSLPPVDNPFGILALLLAVVVAGIAATTDARWRWLAVVPFVAVLLADSPVGDALGGLNNVYVASAFVVFGCFVLFGEVASLAFAAFLGTLVLWQWYDDLLAWPQVIVFVAATLVLRLAVEAFRQNLPLAVQLGRANLLALSGRTLALWWPMLILIAIGLWASAQITGATERFMYERGYVTLYCGIGADDPDMAIPCPAETRTLASERVRYSDDENPGDPEGAPDKCQLRSVNAMRSDAPVPPAEKFACPADPWPDEWELVPLGYFDNLDRTVERRFDLAADDMERKLDTIDTAALDNVDRAEPEARRLFSVVPASTGMKTDTCYFPDIACAAANIAINGLNSAYRRGRDRAEENFVRQMKQRAGKTAGEVLSATDAARAGLGSALLGAKNRTGKFIDRVHTASNLIRQVLLLWLIVVAIKSILYVFARVIFDKSTDIDIDLLERDGVAAEGKVTHRQEINIPGAYPHDIFYKANYQPLGPAPRFSIPQWRASALSRLRFGAWNMSRVAMPLEDERGITFNAIEAEHLVDWELQEGEEVVFSYDNFVAMNANIELRTVISLRVATLLLGRIVFHTARCKGGPGRLVLRTRGKPATAAQVRQSIPAARLVAWNRYARFSVDSHLTRADIFLNGFNLRRGPAETEEGPQGILIVEADARDGGLLFGTLRFARNFLLPV